MKGFKHNAAGKFKIHLINKNNNNFFFLINLKRGQNYKELLFKFFKQNTTYSKVNYYFIFIINNLLVIFKKQTN